MDPRYSPMRLLRIPEPFDHPDFLFEPKIDGFRALAYVPGDRCELVSRRARRQPVAAARGGTRARGPLLLNGARWRDLLPATHPRQ
jgi:hypothetical protein